MEEEPPGEAVASRAAHMKHQRQLLLDRKKQLREEELKAFADAAAGVA